MKKILITGKNSYIGTSVEEWLLRDPNKYKVNTIDLKNDAWKDHDFSQYDVVFHVAGIAHVSSNPKMEEIYYKVNRDLTVETAKKAKSEGVKQFIFMSSIIVYGDISGENRLITRDTVPNPSNAYGRSKLEAEIEIEKLGSTNFKVAILRPPMIYGKGSKGNYQKLAKLARWTPIFPDYNNFRSMLYIENLCEFIKYIIDYKKSGLFFPQNSEFVKISEMVKLIGQIHGKRIVLTKYLSPLIGALSWIGVMKKVFGNLCYEKAMSESKEVNYQLIDLYKSLELTELK